MLLGLVSGMDIIIGHVMLLGLVQGCTCYVIMTRSGMDMLCYHDSFRDGHVMLLGLIQGWPCYVMTSRSGDGHVMLLRVVQG